MMIILISLNPVPISLFLKLLSHIVLHTPLFFYVFSISGSGNGGIILSCYSQPPCNNSGCPRRWTNDSGNIQVIMNYPIRSRRVHVPHICK